MIASFQPIPDAVEIIDGEPMTTSKKIAVAFGKQHSHVIRSIEELLLDEDVKCRSIFGLTYINVQQPQGGTRKAKLYNVSRDGFMLAVMGFTGKRALRVKLWFIDEFNSRGEALRMSQPMLPANTEPPGRKADTLPAPILERIHFPASTLRNSRYVTYDRRLDLYTFRGHMYESKNVDSLKLIEMLGALRMAGINVDAPTMETKALLTFMNRIMREVGQHLQQNYLSEVNVLSNQLPVV